MLLHQALSFFRNYRLFLRAQCTDWWHLDPIVSKAYNLRLLHFLGHIKNTSLGKGSNGSDEDSFVVHVLFVFCF